jgi:hypothetical protein
VLCTSAIVKYIKSNNNNTNNKLPYLHVALSKKETPAKADKFPKINAIQEIAQQCIEKNLYYFFLQRVNATIRPVISKHGESMQYLEVKGSFIGYFLGSIVLSVLCTSALVKYIKSNNNNNNNNNNNKANKSYFYVRCFYKNKAITFHSMCIFTAEFQDCCVSMKLQVFWNMMCPS